MISPHKVVVRLTGDERRTLTRLIAPARIPPPCSDGPKSCFRRHAIEGARINPDPYYYSQRHFCNCKISARLRTQTCGKTLFAIHRSLAHHLGARESTRSRRLPFGPQIQHHAASRQ